MDGIIRRAAASGTFYSDDQEELREMIDGYLRDAKEVKIEGRLRGLVEPHAGYIYSGPTAAYGYKVLAKYKKEVKKIIMIGPSHYASFFGACESGADFWETPLGRVRIGSIRNKVKSEYRSLFSVYPEVHKPEHCLEVQIPFIQVVFGMKEVEIIPILYGQIDPLDFANAIVDQIDEETVIIASSDLSHYLSYDSAIKIDEIANKAVPSLDIEKFKSRGDACGKIGILTLMHLAKKKGWRGVFLDYKNSGDTAGPKTSVVGYGCYAFYEAIK